MNLGIGRGLSSSRIYNIKDITPTSFPAEEEEVVLPILHFRLIFNGRHEARPIVEIVPPQIATLFWGLLNRVNQAIYLGQAGTKPTDPDDDSVRELVQAPFEDELREECPELVWRLNAGSRLRLCHPANLKVGHIDSYGDLPRVRHLHLRAKTAEGGGVLAAGPRGCARLKKGNDIGNLFRLPILILLRDSGHHPAINNGREVGELRVLTLHLGPSLPLTDVPTGRAR
ncbi:hypothetical protein Cgig2_027364 [Carnegiea gigantea]|uniref:Uncharacterized protein n=1 Tax=Carnegiea gigantea TaxID=171969 RepID=A0A9Q1GPC4_9CARY|nr:hypothetical protein Cgig2_027364 [Carnegiea gigantea]